jgi:aldehyde dehydrogenase
VVVDQTADIEQAARDIVRGASFDNNVICTDEKTTIAVGGRRPAGPGDGPARRLRAQGARAAPSRAGDLPRGRARPTSRAGSTRGGSARTPRPILAEIGVRADDDVRLLVARVPNEHNLVWTEQMMPVMPVTEVADIDAAIDLARRSEHLFRHTAGIHSTNVDVITRMARVMNCSIFVANGPTYSGLGHGGEGFCRSRSRPRPVTG